MPRTGLQGYLGGSSAEGLGFIGNELPGPEQAANVQYQAERNVAQRNAYLGRQAQGVFQQGLNTLSAYRPGGAAALTSGMYSGMANALLAQRTEAPDLMARYRHQLSQQQREEAEKKERGAGIGAGLGGIAGAFLGPVGAGAGMKIGGAIGGVFGGMFAKGGIILPTPGGTQMQSPGGNPMTVAEAGQPEVVVPLDQIDEVAQQYEKGQQGQPPKPQSLQPEQGNAQQGAPGPGAPPPLGRQDPQQERAGQPQDEMQAQAAGVPQMAANAGFVGEAFPRAPDDPGVDGLGGVGAAHYASQRLGVPSDVMHAMFLAQEMDAGADRMSPGADLNYRLDYLFAEDEMSLMGVL